MMGNKLLEMADRLEGVNPVLERGRLLSLLRDAVVMLLRSQSNKVSSMGDAWDDVGLAERIAAIIAFNRNKSNFEIARTIRTALQVTEGEK